MFFNGLSSNTTIILMCPCPRFQPCRLLHDGFHSLLRYSLHLASSSLPSGPAKCPGLILYPLCLNSRISSFSRDTVSFKWKVALRSQSLGASRATVPLCALGHKAEDCVYGHSYACIYICISWLTYSRSLGIVPGPLSP